MRLATATGTGEQQPPSRVISEGFRLFVTEFELPLFVRIGIQPLGSQIIEVESCQRSQVAVPLKPLEPIGGEFSQAALASE
jgi:hypothetical protein